MRRKEVKMMTMMASLSPMATSQRTRAVWRKKYGLFAFESLIFLSFLFFFLLHLNFLSPLTIHLPSLRMAVTLRNWNCVRNWRRGSGTSWCPRRRRWRCWSRWWRAASGKDKFPVCSSCFSLTLCVWSSLCQRRTTVPVKRIRLIAVSGRSNVSVQVKKTSRVLELIINFSTHYKKFLLCFSSSLKASSANS